MFVLREAEVGDVDGLVDLAAHLDTLNLPHDPVAVREIVDRSIASFGGDPGVPSGRYVFVLEDIESGAVIGTSSIVAAHGTAEDPHHFLELDVEERYSFTLKRLFRHRVLRLRQSFTPHTELGGLILHPSVRRHPLKLGRAVSYVRFMYISLYPSRFCDELQAELLPPLEADGSSVLWEWLGRRFTGLDYMEADRLSRDNAEFIRSLFPTERLYVSLMPESVQDVLGQVGPATRGVERMLRSIGFRFNQHLDPFDGGPHFAALRTHVTPIRETRRYRALVHDDEAAPAGALEGLVARTGTDGHGLRAVPCRYDVEGDRLRVLPATARALDVVDGDAVAAFAWPRTNRPSPSPLTDGRATGA